eukprot:1924011-Rhodomonas_salina.1
MASGAGLRCGMRGGQELEGMLSNAGGDLFSQVTACRKTVAVTLAGLFNLLSNRRCSSSVHVLTSRA